MNIKLPFELSKPLAGEASINFAQTQEEVFKFVGEQFFENYPKWALEVSEFELLDGPDVFVGAKAKQTRNDNGAIASSVVEVTDYEPVHKLVVQGVNAPYKQSYFLSADEDGLATRLTFRFELMELEVFMWPFEKLIRYAIEEGAENTVSNIKNLLCTENA
jgi:hypothetical protein